MVKKKNLLLWLNLIPTIGILSFAFLFFYASSVYPGGSQASIDLEGFDWLNNYLCNLMSEKAGNGDPNPSRPFAIAALIILCLSLSVFFFQFADKLTQGKLWRMLIKLGGTLSMIFAALIFTKYHDLMTIVSSLFGIIVVVGIIKEIYRSNYFGYKLTGFVCLILLGINNVIYYSSFKIEWLPLIQKLTLLIVLTWILGLNYKIRGKLRQDL